MKPPKGRKPIHAVRDPEAIERVRAADTDGYPGARLLVLADGNLVVYAESGEAIWASHTSR